MKHARILAPALVFLLLAAAGTVWLVRVARGAPAPASASSPDLSGTGTSPAGVDPTGIDPSGAGPAEAGLDPAPDQSGPPVAASPGVSVAATAASPAVVPSARRTAPATARPATSGPGAVPVPVRAIRVGGVTLDDTNPHTMCYAVRNLDSPVTIRITALTAGNPDVVVRPDRCVGARAQEDPPRESWDPTFPCRPGVDLLPHGEGCYTGIEPRSASLPGHQVHSTFTVSLRARCTSAAGRPCSDAGSPAPTAARPVDVTFSQTWRGTDLCIGLPPSDTAFCVPEKP